MQYGKFQSKLVSVLLFGVFSTFLFSSNVAAQKNDNVETLDIIGNRLLTDEELLRHIKTRPGKRFNARQAQEDLQSLLKLGRFNATRTKVFTEPGVRGGVNVIFQVMEMPLVIEINFVGLRYVTKDELLAALREKKIAVAADNPYQPEKLAKAQRIILEYLVKTRGFAAAKVGVAEEEVSAAAVKISFVIDETPDDEDDDCCENENLKTKIITGNLISQPGISEIIRKQSSAGILPATLPKQRRGAIIKRF
jgi:outer membrane protein assembly factor BamA